MNSLAEELIDHLKLNRHQIRKEGIRVEFSPGELVMIQWDGMALMTIDQFRKICDAAS
jgi:hypothetical protein